MTDTIETGTILDRIVAHKRFSQVRLSLTERAHHG